MEFGCVCVAEAAKQRLRAKQVNNGSQQKWETEAKSGQQRDTEGERASDQERSSERVEAETRE